MVPTKTATVTPTIEAITSTPDTAILATGYINLDYVTVWESPSGGIAGKVGLYQAITILEKKELGQLTYFRCTWVTDGVQYKGWILARYVEFGPVPTP